MLDVIKDEFERLGHLDLNAVQALLVFNIGPKTMTAGELRSRGYYQGSNVSYNLKKLVESGFIEHRRCEIDRRSVRVRLTERGIEVHGIVADLFRRHADALCLSERLRPEGVEGMNRDLRQLERYWTEEVRYVY
ncbi:MAG: winged helix DNA-binding protein [Thermohalobaculum sp.]|nr:winged helix DNA-binding protein [Thermohalobaculum sp.]